MINPTPRPFKFARRHPAMWLDGSWIPLTWQTWQLLGFLSDDPSMPFSNDQLCDRFRLGLERESCNEHILQIVHRARKVLQRVGYPDLIETVPGLGYRLVVPKG